MVFTADEGVRGGKVIPLKATVDTALEGCECVRRVFVAERTGGKVDMKAGRDVWLEKVCVQGFIGRVFVAERTGGKVVMKAGRDVWLEKVCVQGFMGRVFVAERTGGKVDMKAGRDVWLEKLCVQGIDTGDVPPPYSEQNLLVIAIFLAEMAKESKCIVCASRFHSLEKKILCPSLVNGAKSCSYRGMHLHIVGERHFQEVAPPSRKSLAYMYKTLRSFEGSGIP